MHLLSLILRSFSRRPNEPTFRIPHCYAFLSVLLTLSLRSGQCRYKTTTLTGKNVRPSIKPRICQDEPYLGPSRRFYRGPEVKHYQAGDWVAGTHGRCSGIGGCGELSSLSSPFGSQSRMGRRDQPVRAQLACVSRILRDNNESSCNCNAERTPILQHGLSGVRLMFVASALG